MNNYNVDVLYIKELAEIVNRSEQLINGFYEDKLEILFKDNIDIIEKNSINYYEYVNKVKSILDDIDDELSNLYRLLMAEIIPGYEELSLSIKKFFNTDFHEEINKLLENIDK